MTEQEDTNGLQAGDIVTPLGGDLMGYDGSILEFTTLPDQEGIYAIVQWHHATIGLPTISTTAVTFLRRIERKRWWEHAQRDQEQIVDADIRPVLDRFYDQLEELHKEKE